MACGRERERKFIYQFYNWILENSNESTIGNIIKTLWMKSIYSHFVEIKKKRFFPSFSLSFFAPFAINGIIRSKWNQLNEKRICLMSRWIESKALREKNEDIKKLCVCVFLLNRHKEWWSRRKIKKNVLILTKK